MASSLGVDGLYENNITTTVGAQSNKLLRPTTHDRKPSRKLMACKNDDNVVSSTGWNFRSRIKRELYGLTENIPRSNIVNHNDSRCLRVILKKKVKDQREKDYGAHASSSKAIHSVYGFGSVVIANRRDCRFTGSFNLDES